MSNQENLLILINQGSDNAESLENTVLNIRSVDNKRITDHHALLITENRPDELSEDERTLYEMIAGRMLESFSGKCKKENTVISLTSADIAFSARGSVMLVAGWRGVFNSQDEEKEEDATLLPAVTQGDRLTVSDCGVLEKQTKPRPIHTESSLLSAMESAGRELENEDEREAMKDAGIGTPATRAGIIETLLLREYMRREKKSLVPTEKGLTVYQAVKDKKDCRYLPQGNRNLCRTDYCRIVGNENRRAGKWKMANRSMPQMQDRPCCVLPKSSQMR
ncbi:hypothetical protein FACS1894207_1170 [Bacteroidia bacterium]|nr:hypothetical protein FACS1894207_1170 [Bacteroidia bacterium]